MYLKRIAAVGVSWPLPADLDDATLEHQMFPPPLPAAPGSRPLPDFTVIHKELKSRQNVTLQLLWEEYHQAHPEGYNYSWYCESYRNWSRNLDIVLRQEHRAGEKTFVDHAGQTVPVTDPTTARCGKATSLWPCWEPAVTPTPRPPGRVTCGTGVVLMYAHSTTFRAPAV